MVKRGPPSLLEKVLIETARNELYSEESEVVKFIHPVMEACIKRGRHLWFWVIAYDLPGTNRKAFYRNLARLKEKSDNKKIKFRYLTRSVIEVQSLKEAVTIYRLVVNCGGNCELFPALYSTIHLKGVLRHLQSISAETKGRIKFRIMKTPSL